MVRIAANFNTSNHYKIRNCYQADELRTFVGNRNNECWIMYTLNSDTGKLVSWKIGRRTKENLRHVISPIVQLSPLEICTDRLMSYKALIPPKIHNNRKYRTNKIERRNLQLRTQLKRLSRKTICFSRAERMLQAVFVLYLNTLRNRAITSTCKLNYFLISLD
jgi:insertion element IS1 protein InsB